MLFGWQPCQQVDHGPEADGYCKKDQTEERGVGPISPGTIGNAFQL